MDIATIIDKLVPSADCRRADYYATLTETWVDTRPIPSEEVIAAAWAEIEAEQALAAVRSAARSALAAQWSALPSWIRGPFGSHYESATHLLDADDDDAAADLIRYAAAPAAYSAEQNAAFEQVRAGLLAAIDSLTQTANQ